MATRVVVDPITRIEGHLRVEAMLDDSSIIQDAMCSGTMWRGIEVILQGRDPRDALGLLRTHLRRLHHGACAGVGARGRKRARHPGSQECRHHPQHHVPDADGAGPRDPLLSSARARLGGRGFGAQGRSGRHRGAGAESFAALADSPPTATSATSPATLKKFVDSGQLGIFQNAYWGHPAYKLPPEANLMAVAHYLEALKWQKEIIKIHTVFGGKNPHPNYLVGGMASAIAHAKRQRHQHGAARPRARPDPAGAAYRGEVCTFPICSPSLRSIRNGPAYGGGLGNYMVYGDMPQNGIADVRSSVSRAASILNKNSSEVLPLDLADPEQVREEIAHSWYNYPDGKDVAASLGRRHRSQLHRSRAALQAARRKRGILLAEGAALEGQRHGSRSAGPHAGRLRERPRGFQRSRQ